MNDISELIYKQRVVPMNEYYQIFALRLGMDKKILKKILHLLQQEGAVRLNYHNPKGACIIVNLGDVRK